MSELKRQRVRDPVHNLIEFDQGDPLERMLWDVVQSPPFQRLRRIRQLGFSDLVYPGATHSRFSHSLGVFHTARRLMKIVERDTGLPPNEKIKRDAALAAALVHDIGHGPFSHAFEQVGKTFDWGLAAEHESHSVALIRSEEGVGGILNRFADGFAERVANVVHGGSASVYRSVVSSQFDADRLDYVRRDRLMTGTGLAAIDFEWLIANLEIGDFDDEGVRSRTFVLGRKALHAAEAFVTGLFQMYPNVYFHKTTRGAEKLMQALLSRVASAVRDARASETGLPANHPLVRLAEAGGTLPVLAELDDFVIWGAVPILREAADTTISGPAERLARRRLLKCFDLGAAFQIELRSAPTEEADEAYLRRVKSASQMLADWSEEKGEGRIFTDVVAREPYKPVSSEGPLNQIWIRDGGELVDLRDLSPAVRATRTWRVFRLYMAEDDEEAKRFAAEIAGEVSRRET
jgi:hypothetical protein